jgi:hypothetical protein
MKFTIERRALVKMLEAIGRKAPSQKWRDKEVRLSACDARVFVEANESTGGVEAMVFEDGTCLLDYKLFLKLLKTHSKKKNVMVEIDERRITFATATLDVTQYSHAVVSPGKFKVFHVTDDWVSQGRIETNARKLPNADKAIIEREKIVDYLLNPEHPIGSKKARYFCQFGFSAKNGKNLRERYDFMG